MISEVHLGFTPHPDESPSTRELLRYIGHHSVAWKGHGHECVVSLEEGRLIINGVLWADNSLLWKGDNVFEAESWPLEVVFDSAAESGVGRLSIRA